MNCALLHKDSVPGGGPGGLEESCNRMASIGPKHRSVPAQKCLNTKTEVQGCINPDDRADSQLVSTLTLHQVHRLHSTCAV